MPPGAPNGPHLLIGPEQVEPVDALAAAAGGRVGLDGVLAALDRSASPAHVRGSAYAFRWALPDSLSPRWWPQGITGSADASSEELFAGRPVLITTSYARPLTGARLGARGGIRQGARITVVDLSVPRRPRYRHVLLVEAVVGGDGMIRTEPVTVHAGGAAWVGHHLHVAATARGLVTFDLRDIVATPGRLAHATFGHGFVLPLRRRLLGRGERSERLRWSFVSLDREGSTSRLLAGEYGHGAMSRRLFSFGLDPSGLPTADGLGVAEPLWVRTDGVERMQGAVAARGRIHLGSSAGRFRRGTWWVGPDTAASPGPAWRPYPAALPVGPEDLSYWRSRDQLWTVTEHLGRRTVAAFDRARFD